MKGLLKNNFRAVCANAKVFSVFLLLTGIFTAAVISQSLVIGYTMIGIIGFSINAAAAAKNEFISKWGKYKLTLPVRRADIIVSLYANLLLWMLIGTIFAGTGVSLSWILHGCPFDQKIDILSMFTLGISISLFSGAIFFPLFYLCGKEKSEALLLISLLVAGVLTLVIVNLCNDLFAPGITGILLGNVVLFIGSLSAFVLSCPFTVGIFRRKEY